MTQTPEGGPTSLECPGCSRKLAVGLPVSAEVVSITLDEDGGADGGASPEGDRRRTLRKRCSEGHVFTVVYDW